MPDEYNLPLGLDIEKIIQKASQVKAILNDLNATALNLGNSATQSFQNASQASTNLGRNVVQQASAFGTTTRSIESMKSAIKTYEEALAQATKTDKIVSLNRSIQMLEDQIKRTSNVGKVGFDEMGNKIKKTKEESDGLGEGLKKIGGILATVFSVTAIIAFAKELKDLAVQASGIERAFGRIGDSTSLAKLRKETQGFVTDLDLERLTVKANNFNIPMEKLGTFLLFASERAKDTGTDVNKLTDNIIDGLGRKSSRIIDNLGISLVDIQKEFKKTGDFTTAVSNLIERDMQASGVAVDTLADKVNRSTVRWKNFKLVVAEFFASSFNFVDEKKIATMTQGARSLADISNKSAEQRNAIIKRQTELVAKLGKEYQNAQKVEDNSKNFNNTKSPFVLSGFAQEDTKSAGERLQAAKNLLKIMSDQNREAREQERIAKGLASLDELRERKAKLLADAGGIVVAKGDKTSSDALARKQLFLDAEEIQRQIDEINGKAEKKRDKEEDSLAKKRLARTKQLNVERIRLENEYQNAQLDAIADTNQRAIKSEELQTAGRVKELENRKKEFPELEKQISKNIEEIKKQSVARVIILEQKGQEEQLKIRKSSQQEIAKILKEDTTVQVNEVVDRYALIFQNARKAGTLTAELEKSLTIQMVKDKEDAVIKIEDNSLKKQEEIALSAILARKRRESQSEKAFEKQNQEDILKINIDFAKKRLALIASDPAKVKEANDLRKAIQDAQNTIDKLGKQKNVDLLDVLGISADKLKNVTDAVASVGDIASDLFSALAEGAQQRVDEIEKQIDAIDDLISKQEEAVEKEKDLMDKGYANNYENAQRGLQAQKQQRDQLLKEQQEAQKQQQALQRAQIVADGIAQASNLVTASTDIFKTFAKIPIIGVPLAIGVIATMFGAFALAKVNAFNATKMAEGGTIGGKSHAEGGNKYVSMDGQSFMEHERGEEVTKKSSAEKHRKLLKAINNDDFTGLSMFDASIQDLLKGTGVYTQLESAKEASANNVGLVDASRTIVINGSSKSEAYLEKIEKRLANMEKQNQAKSTVMDMGDYYIVKTGNYTQKIWKK